MGRWEGLAGEGPPVGGGWALLSGLGQAVGAGCRSSPWRWEPGTHWHLHRLAGLLSTLCLAPDKALAMAQFSTQAPAPAILNVQGPVIQVLITENRAHYQQLASHENEEPFAESHPTKHSLEPSIPWESTQAANGAFLLSTKACTHREAFFISMCVCL